MTLMLRVARVRQPNNVKRGGLCAYIRETLFVRCLSKTYLQQCRILEISVNYRKGYVASLYQSLVKHQMSLISLLTVWRNL